MAIGNAKAKIAAHNSPAAAGLVIVGKNPQQSEKNIPSPHTSAPPSVKGILYYPQKERGTFCGAKGYTHTCQSSAHVGRSGSLCYPSIYIVGKTRPPTSCTYLGTLLPTRSLLQWTATADPHVQCTCVECLRTR